MAKVGLDLPETGYGPLAKVIKAYAALDRAAPPADVAELASVDKGDVSRNNAFLVHVGVVEGKQKKKITEKGKALAHALDYELASETRDAWIALTKDNELFDKTIAAVRVSGPLADDALREKIAFLAGEKRKPRALTGAAAVIEILKLAGKLESDGEGKLRTVTSPPTATPAKEPKAPEKKKPPSVGPEPSGAQERPENRYPVQVVLNVTVRVDEIEEVGPKLRRLFQELGISANIAIESGEEL